MNEAAIWIAVILVGVLALGVREYARASGNFAARWEQVKITFLAGAFILLGVTAAILAVLFIIVIVLVEIRKPLLVILAVIAGLAVLIFLSKPPAKWARSHQAGCGGLHYPPGPASIPIRIKNPRSEFWKLE